MKLQAFDSSFFHGKSLDGDDGLQNMFLYQLAFNMLDLKIGKSPEYVTGGKCKDFF